MNAILKLPTTIARFFRDIAAELRAVEWLSLRQVIEYTLLVILVTALVVISVTLMDALLVAARSGLLDRF